MSGIHQRNRPLRPALKFAKPSVNRVFSTFDLRPSNTPSSPGQLTFDELMIDWGQTPVGSVASIYWPATTAATVLGLANARYAYHALTAADPQTIQVQVNGGLTYVPIPPQTGQKFAGLFTVELPETLTKGQQFTVIVRRVTTATAYVPPPPPPPPPLQSPPVLPGPSKPAAARHRIAVPPPPLMWRNIAGAFQVNIPVKTAEEILPFDENTLAIFKWRLSVMAPTNRWYPVLLRYIQYLSQRIDTHGGNAGSIVGSPTGLPGRAPGHGPGRWTAEPHEPRDVDRSTGKVVKVFYDCFGDFEGFVLGCCEGDKAFHACDRGIERVVVLAMRECVKVDVLVSKKTERIEELVLRC